MPFIKANAQPDERSHEISFGVGVMSTSNVSFRFADMFAQIVSGGIGQVKFEEVSISPVYNLNYRYWIKPKFAIGATLVFGTEKSVGMVAGKYDGNLNRYYSNLTAEVTFNYINRPYLKLYGLGGAGLLYLKQTYTPENRVKEKDSLCAFDFQVTPIGIKAGNKFGAYLEAGFGYKGIISAGIFHKF
jgi:hypothetical protein